MKMFRLSSEGLSEISHYLVNLIKTHRCPSMLRLIFTRHSDLLKMQFIMISTKSVPTSGIILIT